MQAIKCRIPLVKKIKNNRSIALILCETEDIMFPQCQFCPFRRVERDRNRLNFALLIDSQSCLYTAARIIISNSFFFFSETRE